LAPESPAERMALMGVSDLKYHGSASRAVRQLAGPRCSGQAPHPCRESGKSERASGLVNLPNSKEGPMAMNRGREEMIPSSRVERASDFASDPRARSAATW
jgi:hypothetical protein